MRRWTKASALIPGRNGFSAVAYWVTCSAYCYSAEQVTLVFLSVLSAVAVAAIPGGSLPLIAGLLVAFGIPPEGIGIILGVDRLLDMTRTMTNVGSDLVTTAVVDRAQRASGHAGHV